MQVSKLEDQIIEILEKKYGHSIDKDDPLMLTITAQTLVTEHLLELHKRNFEAQFNEFKEDLVNILKKARIDSDESKAMINNHVKKTFLELSDGYKTQLDKEFIKANQEYKKAQKWYKNIKIGSIGLNIIIIWLFIIFFIFTHPFFSQAVKFLKKLCSLD